MMCDKSRWVLAITLLLTHHPALAHADEEEPKPDRTEWAALPLLAGSTDDGFRFGALGAVADYEPEYEPYRWRAQALFSLSVRRRESGTELPKHYDYIRFDIPGLLGGRIRLFPELSFRRLLNAGYYGIGNATPASSDRDTERRYRYLHMETRASLYAWSPLGVPELNLLYGLSGGTVHPSVYGGSVLDDDLRRSGSEVRGTETHGRLEAAVGLVWDSRDHESYPLSGMLHEVSLRAVPGSLTANGMNFGGATVYGRFYVPLAGDDGELVLASRLVVDLLFGTLPFYELGRAGALDPLELPGGGDGIRGVPNGRYHGRIKLVGGLELRSRFVRFELLRKPFHIGVTGFGDAGRLWADYDGGDPRDGGGAGIKYGTGGGVFLQWGESFIFRVEAAYSPDASAGDEHLPVGIYADAGLHY